MSLVYETAINPCCVCMSYAAVGILYAPLPAHTYPRTPPVAVATCENLTPVLCITAYGS